MRRSAEGVRRLTVLTSLLSLSVLGVVACGGEAGDAGDFGATGGTGTTEGSGGTSATDGGTGGAPGGASSSGGAEASGGSSATGGSAPTQPEGFVHPGILVNGEQLAFVKGRLDQEPWKSALAKVKASNYASLSYNSNAHETVQCGSYSNPDVGCSDEKNDAQAAYTHALLWYHTGNVAHAQKAIEIMDDYSSTIKGHTLANAPLQSGWVMETFPRAAEIIRHTYDGWDGAEAFGDMLNDVYLPMIVNGSSSNGNWELSMIEGVINIGIYNDDQVTFDKGVKMWRERVPAYIYLASDGATPVPPPRGNKDSYDALVGFWYNQTTFVDGLMQETCRDFSHSQYGLAAIINAAETARLQGIDLYAEEGERIRKAMGFHAKYINGEAVPAWLCGGSLTDVYGAPMWEIGFNQFATRDGNVMPQTESLVMALRPTGADHHMAWETLTHAGVGTVGLYAPRP